MAKKNKKKQRGPSQRAAAASPNTDVSQKTPPPQDAAGEDGPQELPEGRIPLREHVVVEHKKRPDDPDDWELKLHETLDWFRKNGRTIAVVAAIAIAVVAWVMLSADRRAREERAIWAEYAGAESWARMTGSADSLGAVYKRYQGTPGWGLVGVAYASALIEKGGKEQRAEAIRILERLSTGAEVSPRIDMARDFLARLKKEDAERLKLEAELGPVEAPAPAEKPGSAAIPKPDGAVQPGSDR